MRGGGWPAPEGWILEEVLKSRTVISVPSVVVSRSLLEQVGGFDEDLVMCEDFDLWLRLAVLSEVDAIAQPLTLVLRHSQHSGNDVIAFDDCRRVIEKMLRGSHPPHLRAELLRQRAEFAVQTARCHAARGNRLNALKGLASSIGYSWRYLGWWAVAMRVMARTVL